VAVFHKLPVDAFEPDLELELELAPLFAVADLTLRERSEGDGEQSVVAEAHLALVHGVWHLVVSQVLAIAFHSHLLNHASSARGHVHAVLLLVYDQRHDDVLSLVSPAHAAGLRAQIVQAAFHAEPAAVVLELVVVADVAWLKSVIHLVFLGT
jgi:hypothetical protein